jgi:hypothetical protein
MGIPREGSPYWYRRFKRAVKANEGLVKENSRLITELDGMRCANENLKRMNQTQVEQLRDLTHEVAELKDQKETLRANVSYYAKQCRKWSEEWNLQKAQYAATVADLQGKLDHSRLARGTALAERDIAIGELDEATEQMEDMVEKLGETVEGTAKRIDGERKDWECKLYRMKQSRDALWGGVRDALEMLKRRDIKPKGTKKAAIERLEAAKGDGLLTVMEYDSELEKLKEALFEQRENTEKWRKEAKSKRFPGLQFVRIDKDSVLGQLWKKWFPHTPVPKDLTVDRLYRYVMGDYERRLKNVEDRVARSSKDQMDHDCRIVCDMCRQMSDNPFLGHPYPDPLSEGRWVHNVRTREGKALAVRCEASAIMEEHREVGK